MINARHRSNAIGWPGAGGRARQEKLRATRVRPVGRGRPGNAGRAAFPPQIEIFQMQKRALYICSSEESSNKLTIYDMQLVNYTDANQFPNLISF